MDRSKREQLVYRIITGEIVITVNNVTYKTIPVTPSIKLQASKIYEDTIRQNRFDGWLTDKACLHLLVSNGLCSSNIDSNLQEIEKEIDNIKVALYTSMFIPDVHTETRRRLKAVQRKHQEMIATRHSFDHLTIRGFAEMIKRQYLVYETLRYLDGTKVWNNLDEVDSLLLENITSEILSNSISLAEIREISRTEPWRNYWGLYKGNIFNSSIFNWTDEQRTLILFSKMYDSAYSHPNCPTDEIMADDDLFDGWMIYERRKNEKNKMKHQFDQRMSKHNQRMANADEVFVPVKSKEDAKRVYSMNDTQGNIIRAQRKAVIKKKGKAVDSDFQDRKLQLQQESNRQFIKNARGK